MEGVDPILEILWIWGYTLLLVSSNSNFSPFSIIFNYETIPSTFLTDLSHWYDEESGSVSCFLIRCFWREEFRSNLATQKVQRNGNSFLWRFNLWQFSSLIVEHSRVQSSQTNGPPWQFGKWNNIRENCRYSAWEKRYIKNYNLILYLCSNFEGLLVVILFEGSSQK